MGLLDKFILINNVISFCASIATFVTLGLACLINKKISSAVNKRDLIKDLPDALAELQGYLDAAKAHALNPTEMLSALIVIKEKHRDVLEQHTMDYLNNCIELAESFTGNDEDYKKLIKDLSAFKINLEKDASKTW